MLSQISPGLPALWYYDPQHFAREMKAIWQQQWICVGRESDWPASGDYHVISLGDQNILVLRTESGTFKAFHNTCRHRGAVLCEQASGQLSQGRIVCPYHTWTYDSEGQLQGTPRRVETEDFDARQYSLYGVALQTWGGFVFISLADSPRASLSESHGHETDHLKNWPLGSLQLAHREENEVACNWKVFWENYLECYHCPGTHPELCRLVPTYSQGFLSKEDFHAVGRESPTPAGQLLRESAETWAVDGISGLPLIEGPTEAERALGMTFATLFPTMFVVAHQDYVRSVRVVPLGPETTHLTVDWLLPASSMNAEPALIEKMTSFARQVVKEDARACELNQKGLKSNRHQQGVLMPQEYDVLAFDNWVRERLGEAL